jgi:hypothetical protein
MSRCGSPSVSLAGRRDVMHADVARTDDAPEARRLRGRLCGSAMAGIAPPGIAPPVRLQLCTGKTCRREGNATAVLAVLRKLAPPPDCLQLTTASCLSRCGGGPHLVLRDSGQELSLPECAKNDQALTLACLQLLRGVGLSADELERVEQRADMLLAPQG